MGDQPDAFETVTAVNDGPVPREALPTDAIKPLAKPNEGRAARAVGSVGLIPIDKRAHADSIDKRTDGDPIDKGAHADSVAEERGVPPLGESPEHDQARSYAVSQARGMP